MEEDLAVNYLVVHNLFDVVNDNENEDAAVGCGEFNSCKIYSTEEKRNFRITRINRKRNVLDAVFDEHQNKVCNEAAVEFPQKTNVNEN